MTAPPSGGATASPVSADGAARRRVRRSAYPPALGWSSVGLLLLMLIVAGFAIDAPRLARVGPGGVSQTAFLPWVMALAGVVGAGLARVRLPAVVAHLLGAVIGTGVLVLAWAWAISDAPSLTARLSAVNQAAATLFDDVFIQRGTTQETIGFLIVVGAIAWTTGQFAAYNLVRRAIVAPAIVAVGTFVLVVALAPAVDEAMIFGHLVVLTGLALLLLLRASLWQQEVGWRRRRIVGGRTVERLFLGGGAVICAIALGGAALLAANVSAAPLRETLTSVDQRLLDLAEAIDSLFGRSGTSSATGSYGDLAPISDSWSRSQTTMFTWSSPDGRSRYWRGAAYARFTGRGWLRDGRAEARTATRAGGDPLAASVDSVAGDASGRRDATYTLVNRGLDGRTLLSPATPISVDRDTVSRLDGPGGPFLQIDLTAQLGLDESVAVAVRADRRGGEGLTRNLLAAAGTSYPTWVRPYTEWVPGTLSDLALDTASRIANADPAQRTPFHIAERMEAWFAGVGEFSDAEDPFLYETDLSGLCRPAEGLVDCLLRTRRGFCQQYATAMTLMLRSQGIPARYVLGFLPGEEMADGSYRVPAAAAHAWVEVYFPDVGWVPFDPTPGGNRANGQQTSNLPEGDPVPTPPTPSGAPVPTPVFSDPPTPEPVTPPPGTVTPPSDGGDRDLPWPMLGLLLLAGALLVGVVAAMRWLDRVPGRDPDLLYRATGALARRLGHGPLPAQTPYEFGAGLAEVVPGAATDIQAVTRAKVEATYGGRRPEGDALDALVASFQHVRRSLVALLLRGRPRR